MTGTGNPQRQAAVRAPLRLADALVISVWVGLATGLLEAFLTFGTRFAPAITPYRKAGPEIFWVAPLAYALIFPLQGILLAWLARIPLKIRGELLVLGVQSAIGCYAVLSYPRMIQVAGVVSLSLGSAVVLCRAVRGREEAFVAFLRRNLLPAVLAVAVIGGVIPGWFVLRERLAVNRLPAAASDAPNVLIIVVDALRGDRLSSAGYYRKTTPNFDAFGREGVQFDHAFSTAPWTMPSFATFLTGRYTHEHLMDYPVPRFNHGFPYLPQVLARYGYRSAFFSANVGPGTQEYLDAGFQHYDTYTVESTLVRMSLLRKFVWQVEEHAGIHLPRSKRAPRITKPFLEWVDRNPGGPFFALLDYIDVHDHFRWEWGTLPPFDTRFGDARPRWARGGPNYTKDLVDLFYDSAVAYTDDQVGQLLDELRKRGLDKNTLVIIASDHGEGLLQHGHLAHAGSLYFDQLHVPLLIRFPGKVPAGERVSRPVSLAALPATVMHMLELPAAFPGRPLPLSEAAAANDPARDEPLLAEFNTLQAARWKKSLLDSRWHYIYEFTTGAEELYDWRADPGETLNLLQGEEGRRDAAEYSTRLKEFRSMMLTTASAPAPRTYTNQ
jgi:arylsulfatase A-like enzyme